MNEKFEQRPHNFEPSIRYVVELKATTQGIRMSRKVESILVIRQ
jgi:GTP cyclohydrolase FolE2